MSVERPYITCRELIDFLYLYLDDELPADPRSEFERHLGRISPTARIAEPEDVARAVLYLASPRCTHITGHALMVDGGQSAMEPLPI